MNRSPLEKRAARKARNKSMMDLNLVSLIDIFIILIFFLLTNVMVVQGVLMFEGARDHSTRDPRASSERASRSKARSR